MLRLKPTTVGVDSPTDAKWMGGRLKTNWFLRQGRAEAEATSIQKSEADAEAEAEATSVL